MKLMPRKKNLVGEKAVHMCYSNIEQHRFECCCTKKIKIKIVNFLKAKHGK
jgi:hypothetical protein